jgi:hypothetical protein
VVRYTLSSLSSNNFKWLKEMKTYKTLVIFLTHISIVLLLISCSGGSNPQPASPQDQAKALLTSGTWKLQSESVDGVDLTALFNGFTITFTSSGYTTTKGGAIWPASGTWSFQGTSTTTIVRNDGVVVQLQLASSSLVMTIDWPTTTLGGKIESTRGSNVFTMIK